MTSLPGDYPDKDIEPTMTIIDFHTHFFPESLFRAIWNWFEKFGWGARHKFLADELIEQLKSIGVSKMVLLNYAHKTGMSRSLNQWTKDLAEKHPEIIPFGAAHPHDEDCESIVDQCFDEFGFYGLKLHVHVLEIAADDPSFFPIYEKIEAAGKVLMLHAGNGPALKQRAMELDKVAGVDRVRVILKRYPNLKLVIPHLGVNQPDEFFDLMEEHENLWLDTAMALSRYFPETPSLERIEKFSDRILYGSDSPNIPYPLETEMSNVKTWFSEEVQEKLFYKNALRLLDIEL